MSAGFPYNEGRVSDYLALSLNDDKVKYWINKLLENRPNPIHHGSKDSLLENSSFKLWAYGIGEKDCDEIKIFNDFLEKWLLGEFDKSGMTGEVYIVITACHLAASDRNNGTALEYAIKRLDDLEEFVSLNKFDIYADKADYPLIPKSRDIHPLVDKKWCSMECFAIPSIHDMWLIAYTYANMSDVYKQKADALLKCIIKPEYQELNRGYGLMYVPPKKYYSIGWSVHLPFPFGTSNNESSVYHAAWMSYYKGSKDVVKIIMDELDKHRTEDGLWQFPSEWLKEGKDRYAVFGGHMGMAENRRKRISRIIESTAWRLKIEAIQNENL